jgi:hypothetical protein
MNDSETELTPEEIEELAEKLALITPLIPVAIAAGIAILADMVRTFNTLTADPLGICPVPDEAIDNQS